MPDTTCIASDADARLRRKHIPPNPERESIRPREAALLLGISVATLYRWRDARPDFPRPLKLGERTTVYSRRELLTFLHQRPTAGQR